MEVRHAVFVTLNDHYRARVSRYSDWMTAQNEWERLDDMRRDGRMSGVKFLEVRSGDDPKYNTLPMEPWHVLADDQKPTSVKLERSQRERLLRLGREQHDITAAADAMFTEVAADSRWEHLEAVVISDYTWAAARFCFPKEAQYL